MAGAILGTPVIAQLETASGPVLLRTFASLTHRLHESNEQKLRDQRDRVEAEILRRMGTLR